MKCPNDLLTHTLAVLPLIIPKTVFIIHKQEHSFQVFFALCDFNFKLMRICIINKME